MTPIRVVVYAEGTREASGARVPLPPPGDPLPEAALGPAHILVRRCLAEHAPLEQIRFDVPLLTRGRRARGSDLHRASTLRQLCTWAMPLAKPDVAVVIVDADGETGRLRIIRQALEGRRDVQPPVVVGVAIHEFEAWMLADDAALRKHLGFADDPLPRPETLAPRQAKAVVLELLAKKSADKDTQKALLVQLADAVDLAVVASICTAFEHLRSELHAIGKAQ